MSRDGLETKNFRELLMSDRESRDMYHCHPYLFVEICIPLVKGSSGPIGYSILRILAGHDQKKRELTGCFA